MKIRHGFVSNSSSSSFAIENTTDQVYSMDEFAEEHRDLISLFIQDRLTWYTFADIMASANELPELLPGVNSVAFSNEDGNIASAFFRTFFDWQADAASDNFNWQLEWNSQSYEE